MSDPNEHEARPLFVDEAVMVRPTDLDLIRSAKAKRDRLFTPAGSSKADLLDAMMAAF
jgi:hypothetical protein